MSLSLSALRAGAARGQHWRVVAQGEVEQQDGYNVPSPADNPTDKNMDLTVDLPSYIMVIFP